MMGALIIHDDSLEKISEKLEMAEKLVWYARKDPANHPSWEGIPEDIKVGAMNAAAKIEEMFPDEVDDLRSEHGDWQHGFNSGLLAAFRYVFGVAEDPEWAEENFPELDT